MKYYLRLLWLILTWRRRPPCALRDACTTPFRVWPNDLDVFMHMNNGAYLTIADLGRTDLMLRSGTFGPIRARGWYPVVAGETIRFRRSLRPFQRYAVVTRLLGWTDRSIYLEQRFESGGEPVARALIDARFLGPRGARVSIAELMEAVDVDDASPALPGWVETWARSMREMEGVDGGGGERCAGVRDDANGRSAAPG